MAPFDNVPHTTRVLTATTTTNAELFAEVRALCGIDDAAYAAAFEAPPTAEKFSEGRSGAFLYFSRSGEYIVKTTTKAEAVTLMRLMPACVGAPRRARVGGYVRSFRTAGAAPLSRALLAGRAVFLHRSSIPFATGISKPLGWS